MNSQEGVKTVILSGLRATVIMKKGSSLDEAKVKAALEGEKMKFVSLAATNVIRPKAAYVLSVEGAT